MNLTKEMREVVLANRKSHMKVSGGRQWKGRGRELLLEANMVYWVVWNRMIDRVADARYQLETLDLRVLCEEEKLGSRKECQRPMDNANVNRVSHGGSGDSITWSELEAFAPHATRSTKRLALEYGYSDSEED
mmetsp:Transcript_24615/g.72212  ORF Transcript_24615/g.72212 Transcript_24615/m.72212 type:complete len:133 (+) Transcript_24615:842-1240(+)